MLRAVLRQDPDIVAVGEIRDAETAEITMRAAITGHLVQTICPFIPMMQSYDNQPSRDGGVAPFLIADALKGMVSQRLVRENLPRLQGKRTFRRKRKDVPWEQKRADTIPWKGPSPLFRH